MLGKDNGKSKLKGKLPNFLLHKYTGSVLFVGEEDTFKPDTKIALACGDNTLHRYHPKLIHLIDQHTIDPLDIVNIQTSSKHDENISLPPTWQSVYTANLNAKIEYLEDSSVIDGLMKHVSEKNVGLLLTGRNKRRRFNNSLIFRKGSTATDVVNKMKLPLLIMGSNFEGTLLNGNKV